jgi:hypothetical protein
MPTSYELIKDFAGPVATLIAAVTAVYVTSRFSRSQLRIAESQRDIALDKLKYDLFEKRYEIYQACKDLLEHISLVTDVTKSDASRIRSLYIKIDEARFYFPKAITGYLIYIHRECEAFLQHLAERDQINVDDAEKWSRMAELLSQHQAELRQAYATLPEMFESSLAFRQLTAPQ